MSTALSDHGFLLMAYRRLPDFHMFHRGFKVRYHLYLYLASLEALKTLIINDGVMVMKHIRVEIQVCSNCRASLLLTLCRQTHRVSATVKILSKYLK